MPQVDRLGGTRRVCNTTLPVISPSSLISVNLVHRFPVGSVRIAIQTATGEPFHLEDFCEALCCPMSSYRSADLDCIRTADCSIPASCRAAGPTIACTFKSESEVGHNQKQGKRRKQAIWHLE